MSAQERIDALELVKNVKELEGVIVEKFTELKDNGETLKGQIAELGEAKAETIQKHEASEKQYNDLYDRMQTLEQRTEAKAESAADKTVGEQFLKFDGTVAMLECKAQSARMELKTVIINTTMPARTRRMAFRTLRIVIRCPRQAAQRRGRLRQVEPQYWQTPAENKTFGLGGLRALKSRRARRSPGRGPRPPCPCAPPGRSRPIGTAPPGRLRPE